MIEIFTRKSWSNMGGDCGCDEPLSKGIHTTENALMYMRGLQRLWDRVENKTDMPRKYRNWKYTDQYDMDIWAIVEGVVVPLEAPRSWPEEERREYAKARDIVHLSELQVKFQKNLTGRIRALYPDEDEGRSDPYRRLREEYESPYRPPESA